MLDSGIYATNFGKLLKLYNQYEELWYRFRILTLGRRRGWTAVATKVGDGYLGVLLGEVNLCVIFIPRISVFVQSAPLRSVF